MPELDIGVMCEYMPMWFLISDGMNGVLETSLQPVMTTLDVKREHGNKY